MRLIAFDGDKEERHIAILERLNVKIGQLWQRHIEDRRPSALITQWMTSH